MCLDSQTGLQCISEPLVARCHGKDLTAACKCSVPSQMCAVGCCACPLKAKRDEHRHAVDVNLKQIVITVNICAFSVLMFFFFMYQQALLQHL